MSDVITHSYSLDKLETSVSQASENTNKAIEDLGNRERVLEASMDNGS